MLNFKCCLLLFLPCLNWSYIQTTTAVFPYLVVDCCTCIHDTYCISWSKCCDDSKQQSVKLSCPSIHDVVVAVWRKDSLLLLLLRTAVAECHYVVYRQQQYNDISIYCCIYVAVFHDRSTYFTCTTILCTAVLLLLFYTEYNGATFIVQVVCSVSRSTLQLVTAPQPGQTGRLVRYNSSDSSLNIVQ